VLNILVRKWIPAAHTTTGSLLHYLHETEIVQKVTVSSVRRKVW